LHTQDSINKNTHNNPTPEAIEKFLDHENDKKNAINTASLIAGALAYKFKASPFGIIHSIHNITQLLSTLNLTTTDDLTNPTMIFYPYAHAWYKELSQKHNSADFENYDFRFHPADITDSLQEAGWAVHPNRIYATNFVFNKINDLCSKKAHGEILTDEEELSLNTAEFFALHEAGHLKNNDMTTGRPFINAGLAVATEAGYQTYKKYNPTRIQKTLPKRIMIGSGIYLALSFTQHGLYNIYSRYTENRADNFAIQNSSVEVLQGGIRGLKSLQEIEAANFTTQSMPLLYHTHPTTESRIEKIQAEITRRELDKIK